MYARVTRVSASRFTVHCMARFEERRRNVLAQAPADGARIGGGSLIRDAVRRFGPGPRVRGFGPGRRAGATSAGGFFVVERQRIALGGQIARRYSGGMKRPPPLALALALLAVMAAAHAAPPPGADPALAPWFHQLRRPGSGFPCCSEADCRNVEVRAAGSRTEVYIGREAFGSRAPNAWVPVPPAHVLLGLDNPTGGPIACWAAWGGVLCFVPGSGT